MDKHSLVWGWAITPSCKDFISRARSVFGRRKGPLVFMRDPETGRTLLGVTSYREGEGELEIERTPDKVPFISFGNTGQNGDGPHGWGYVEPPWSEPKCGQAVRWVISKIDYLAKVRWGIILTGG